MKYCSKCKTNKPLDQFNTDKARSDGKMIYCKLCMKVINKEIRARNNAQRTEYNKQYRERNRSNHNAWERDHYAANASKRNQQGKKWRESRSGSIRMLHLTAQQRAKRKGLEYQLSHETIDALLMIQKDICSLTGIAFVYDSDERFRYRPFAPSIDRKDNSLGYTFDNIRIVTCIVNKARNEYSLELFDEMCIARARMIDG